MMIIFMALVATISLHSLNAMEKKSDFNQEDFYVMERCQQHIKKEFFQNPEKLCFICHRLSQDYEGESSVKIIVSQDLKKILAQNKIELAEFKDKSGRTALHLACTMQGRLKEAVPILLETVNDNQLFKLLATTENTSATILHYAATNGLVGVLTALIKAADRYAKDCPERKKDILKWLEMKNFFGLTAKDLATQGCLLFKEKNFKDSIKILEDAQNKF